MKLSKGIKIFLLFITLTCAFCFETATETEEGINNKIFISEGVMKHRKSHMRKNEKLYTSNYKSPSTAINPSAQMGGGAAIDKVSSDGKVASTSNLLGVANGLNSGNNSTDAGQEEIKLGKGPIFFTGWMKYFKFSSDEKNLSAPKHFFKNNYFYEQKKIFPKANINETSSDGTNTVNTYIKTPTSFYIVVFKNNINFVSSRQIQTQKTFDTVPIESISPVIEMKGFGEQTDKNNKNGIQDFGNFSEGFCLKVLTQFEVWILCSESEKEKTQFMNIVKQMKLETQRKDGKIEMGHETKKQTSTISEMLNNPEEATRKLNTDAAGNMGVSFNANQKLTDGYWITLQDWSQCSLKCGGGTSTLQRMCVPPKDGGNPCEGQAVMTKPCNTHACPNVAGTKEGGKSNNTIVMKPEIKVMTFSNRPQRYSKCIIKESDLMMTLDLTKAGEQDNPNLQPPQTSGKNQIPDTQVPVRVIMNNKTITIFTGESYDSQVKTFNLPTSQLKTSGKNKNCFVLVEMKKRAELCPFGANPTGGKMIDEWDYDFNLFKNQCATEREKITLGIEEKLQKKLDEKIKKAKKEIMDERELEIKKTVAQSEQVQMDKIVKSTNAVALQAIQKEINLESLIKQEEAQREKNEELEMLKTIEAEKKKSECLMKAIKEREIENQFNVKVREAEEEVKNIKKAATQQVMIRRSQLKTQIMQMRKQSQQRKAKLAQQLLHVRSSMAQTMGKAYKKGDAAKCQKALTSEQEKNNYCQANFFDDYAKMTDCKEGEEFCQLCCETEFGDLHVTERKTCISTICPVKSKSGTTGAPGTSGTPTGSPIPGSEEGSWIWHNKLEDFNTQESNTETVTKN